MTLPGADPEDAGLETQESDGESWYAGWADIVVRIDEDRDVFVAMAPGS